MARLRRKRNVKIVIRRGRYVVEYRDDTGRRPRPSFATKKEAEEHKREVELAFEGYISLTRNRPAHPVQNQQSDSAKELPAITLKEAIRRCTDVINAKRMKETRTTEKYHFERLWVWMTNAKKIQFIADIQSMHIEEFQSVLLAGNGKRPPLAASTVNRMFATYSVLFKKCLSWGLIAKSPMDGIKDLPERPATIRTWTPAQLKTVIEKLPTWASEAEYFIARTGCRPVDVERARFRDIDIERRRIRFTSFKGSQIYESFLPMSEDLVLFLTDIRERARRKFRGKDDDLVFVNTRGEPVTHNALGKALRAIREGNKELEGLTSYGLRHSFIDALVDMGIHPRDIQLLARHRKFETTTRYTHRKSDHLRSIVNAVSSGGSVTEQKELGHKVVTEGELGRQASTSS